MQNLMSKSRAMWARLAHLPRLELGQLVGVRADEARALAQERPALPRADVAPRRVVGRAGPPDGGVHLGRAAAVHGRDLITVPVAVSRTANACSGTARPRAGAERAAGRSRRPPAGRARRGSAPRERWNASRAAGFARLSRLATLSGCRPRRRFTGDLQDLAGERARQLGHGEHPVGYMAGRAGPSAPRPWGSLSVQLGGQLDAPGASVTNILGICPGPSPATARSTTSASVTSGKVSTAG